MTPLAQVLTALLLDDGQPPDPMPRPTPSVVRPFMRDALRGMVPPPVIRQVYRDPERQHAEPVPSYHAGPYDNTPWDVRRY